MHRTRGIPMSTAAALLAGLLPWSPVSAAGYAIEWSTLQPGGGTASGGGYTLEGTIGQPLAGHASGGGYALDAGFRTPGATARGEQAFRDGFEGR